MRFKSAVPMCRTSAMLRDSHTERETDCRESWNLGREDEANFGKKPKRREGEVWGRREEVREKRQITNVTPKMESAVSVLEATVTHAW